MYNRYIPQADGSYRRSHIPDPRPTQPPPRHDPPKKDCPCRSESPKKPPANECGAGNFLRNLLPKDFDTSDLLVVVLLLLMTGDCAEDKSTTLLTLIIYLLQ